MAPPVFTYAYGTVSLFAGLDYHTSATDAEMALILSEDCINSNCNCPGRYLSELLIPVLRRQFASAYPVLDAEIKGLGSTSEDAQRASALLATLRDQSPSKQVSSMSND